MRTRVSSNPLDPELEIHRERHISARDLETHLKKGPSAKLISPHGGSLVDLTGSPDALDELRARAQQLNKIQISERSSYDLELLATGAFSPLDRFMGHRDYQMVVDQMRLSNGLLFPIPVTLPIQPSYEISLDQEVALTDARNEILAMMTVKDIYPWNRREVVSKVFGTQDPRHPLVA